MLFSVKAFLGSSWYASRKYWRADLGSLWFNAETPCRFSRATLSSALSSVSSRWRTAFAFPEATSLIDLPRHGRPGFQFVFASAVDRGFRILPGGQLVVALSALNVSLQLGDVAEVVERERIIGVDEIGAVKELLCFLQMVLANFVYALLVERLHR